MHSSLFSIIFIALFAVGMILQQNLNFENFGEGEDVDDGIRLMRQID